MIYTVHVIPFAGGIPLEHRIEAVILKIQLFETQSDYDFKTFYDWILNI